MEETVNEIPTSLEVLAPAEETLEPPCEETSSGVRAEIDTSAPFESVKEAVDRFGGSAVWKSQLKQLFSTKKHEQNSGELEVSILEEQTAQLEKDLVIKERETLNVLKELESTKKIVADLKSKIQKELEFEIESNPISNSSEIHPSNEPESDLIISHETTKCPNILNELKQAKLNLNKTTSDLSSIRAQIDFLNTSIEKEKTLLEKTREKLSQNRAIVSSLEKDLNFTTQKLQLLTEQKTHEEEEKENHNPLEVSREIKEMNLKLESAQSEVANLTAEIEQTKTSIKTTEIKFIAAQKTEEAAKESEKIAIMEIEALLSSNNIEALDDSITLTSEEYEDLNSKAREADEASRRKVEEVMYEIDEANRSKLESLEKLEKARLDAKQSRKVLEEALKRVETAHQEKIRVEESLRKLRCQKIRVSHGSQSSEKFKKVAGRRDYSYNYNKVIDDEDYDNGSGFESESEGEPTLSIGQILSMKLTGPGLGLEEYDKRVKRVDSDNNNNNNNMVSLGQMLSRKYAVLDGKNGSDKENSVKKRKKFGFVGVGISVLLAKQQRSKKKRSSLG